MADNILDDPERLKAARDAADRDYNEALTRLDRAIQQIPSSFPQPPPGPDEHQITPLNALWKIDQPTGAPTGWLATIIRRAVAPLIGQQQAFNAAVVDHINRNVAVGRETQASIATTLTMVREQLSALVTFQSQLVIFLQQITPYVDTRDRDVAGLLRGLSGAINTVADEVLKRSESTLARDRRLDLRANALDAALEDLHARVSELQRALGPGAAGRA